MAGTQGSAVRDISGVLYPGQVDIRYFRLLVTVCVLHSPGIKQALEDVLVHGKTRQEACRNNGVSQSYFSVKYRHMQMVSQTVFRMCDFISHTRNEATSV
ncbi:PapB/FocB family fimbrial expression transcriptional regulator [Citrobacter braakii]|uniref:PapB/FocB family fimbrial expression transcriptional regulator n=1 Tax=Citrobacter braakii TaxID=57706 RepID=UPI002B251CF9|nr:PapB/FocB family fimbrial expression transcriptional regulator [Citrobacter braakii]MEB2307503.1 PapB/FocB family fimbrial expression transcriptional regulator [Citrobacter braakii]